MAGKSPKEKEADQLISKGEKLSKGGWFSSSDWAGAAEAYEQAATAYKVARVHVAAIEALKKAANAWQKAKLDLSAARCLDNGGQIAKDKQLFAEAANLYYQAGQLFISNSNNQKAAETITKAGKCAETVDQDKALQYYMESCDLFEADDKEQFAGDTFKYALTFLLKLKK